jgi:hypothetical protein
VDWSAEKWVAFVMTFAPDSGHGGKTRDLDGDEPDGWDEGGAVMLSSPTVLTERR